MELLSPHSSIFNLDRRHSALGYRSLHYLERDYLFSIS